MTEPKMVDVNALIAYCESSADVSKHLYETVMDKIGKGESETSAIGAVAYFMRQETMYRYEIPNIIRCFTEKDGEA